MTMTFRTIFGGFLLLAMPFTLSAQEMGHPAIVDEPQPIGYIEVYHLLRTSQNFWQGILPVPVGRIEVFDGQPILPEVFDGLAPCLRGDPGRGLTLNQNWRFRFITHAREPGQIRMISGLDLSAIEKQTESLGDQIAGITPDQNFAVLSVTPDLDADEFGITRAFVGRDWDKSTIRFEVLSGVFEAPIWMVPDDQEHEPLPSLEEGWINGFRIGGRPGNNAPIRPTRLRVRDRYNRNVLSDQYSFPFIDSKIVTGNPYEVVRTGVAQENGGTLVTFGLRVPRAAVVRLIAVAEGQRGVVCGTPQSSAEPEWFLMTDSAVGRATKLSGFLSPASTAVFRSSEAGIFAMALTTQTTIINRVNRSENNHILISFDDEPFRALTFADIVVRDPDSDR